jgi:DNA-directed RNA polymerase specialized sigma24 family protein
MKTNVSYYQNKKEFRLFVTQSYSQLIQLKKEGNQASFNDLVLKIMPQIRQYINTQLNIAIRKGHFSKNKFKADDIIDQLFIEIYDHIEEVKQADDFYLWLFKKTNDLLEDITVEEEFDEFFFKNIDDYTRPEWDAMQEKYSSDADGDGHLLMIEEFEDRSYNHNDYTLNHVFIENDEKALIKKIDKDLSDEDVKHHIELVLHNLPVNMRKVFELATIQHLELEEIAQIRHQTLEEVKQLLNDAKNALQVSLFNRYSVN